MMRSRKKPVEQVNIAKERIDILFEQALKQAKKDQLKLSNRYVFIARKIGMKLNVKISKELKRKFCHKCYHYLFPGKNLKVRTNKNTKAVEYTCLDCGKINRYPYAIKK